ncbi:MAG: hypothetical protein FJ405_02175, partial [Verrucomicrobia bacterium]|nr:hypothetical protein [Verrucomicrobiota bacterium]
MSDWIRSILPSHPCPRVLNSGSQSFPVMSHASLPALAWRVLALLLTGSTLDAQTLIPAPAADARIASGFELRVFADSTLADDIQAMTIDSVGRVVVTGPGYIRTLFDDNSDGFADRSVPFAKTETGGMGLCFSGTTLLFSGDGGLWRYLDENLDGIADAAPLKLMTLKGGEHGIHGIRQGPDGSWFVVAGNDAGAVAGTATDPRSSVRIPQAGSILRMNNQNAQVGIFCHGLRNPYDLDFNSYGDLFTYDSDVERELHLPWYTPTRVYHTGPGAHHGWRLNGYQRSFKRPDHYPGVVPD